MKYFFLIIFFTLASIAGQAETVSISQISGINTIHPELNSPISNFKINIHLPGSGNLNIHLKKHKLKSAKPQFTLANGEIQNDTAAIKLFRGTTRQLNKTLKVAAASYQIKNQNLLQISFISVSRISKRKQFNHLTVPIKTGQRQAKLTSIRRFKFSDLPISTELTKSAVHDDLLQATTPVSNSRSLQTMLELELSVDGDSHWYSIFGSSSNTALSDYINTTETVYQSELGVTFNVVRINVFTDLSFGTSNPYSKLCNYQYYTTGANSLAESNANCATASSPAGPQSYFGTADAYYLFSGQDLEGSTIGIAFYSAICRAPQQAVGVVQYYSAYPALLPMTFAHELGHNFSAIHDGYENNNGINTVNCSGAPANKIMSATLSSLPKDFSDCSLNTINDFLANYNTCMPQVQVEIPDPSPSPSPTPSASPIPSTTPLPAAIRLSAKLNKSGQFLADLKLSNNVGYCSSKLYISHKKNYFDETQAITFTQNIDLSFSTSLKATILPNKNNKYLSVFIKATSSCSGQYAESSVIKINPGKVSSSKALTRSAWVKRIIKKLKSKYGL